MFRKKERMTMDEKAYRPGLEGVIATETAISYLDVEGEEIVVRGYDLIELAQKKTYLDVVGLLLNGKLPSSAEYEQLENELKAAYALPSAVFEVLKQLPKTTHAMDMLRTGISALAGFDEQLEDRSEAANRRKVLRLLAKIPAIVANTPRIKEGKAPIQPRNDLPFAANFLYMITGKEPTESEVHAFDQSLIVYSEHEMPNSTFAARVIASTQADLYGALTGSVASLKGTLHGGANEAVMYMLLDAKTKDNIEPLILDKLAKKERIMGFGHRVYMRKMDPRAQLMKEALKQLVDERGRAEEKELYDMCAIGEAVMHREKGLYPNLDYYAAPVYYLLGIPIELYTPIFFAARTAGIGAHVIEQHANNRLFRPRVHYTGPRGLHP